METETSWIKADIFVGSKTDRKTLIHELLHEVSEHSRVDADNYGFLEKLLIPTDRRNYNYHSTNILNAAIERGIIK